MIRDSHSQPRIPLARPKPAEAEWAVLVYTSSTPDIEAATKAGLQEMCQAIDGSTPVVVQWGKAGQAQRFEVSDGALQALEPSQSVDMARPDTLGDFLKWGMKRYPARHYAVVVGGHGAGFLGSPTNSQKNRMMRLPELRQAFESAPYKPDVIAFNTCLMDCSETAAEMRDTASAMVATQAGEKDLGMPLGDWIAALPHCPDAASAARSLVDKCRTTPLRTTHVSALDLSKIEAYTESLDQLSLQILDHPEARGTIQSDLRALGGYWEHSWDFALYRQVDVGSLCQRLSQDQLLPAELREAAHDTLTRAGAVVLEKSQAEGLGLSLFAPDKPWESTPMFDKKMGQVYGDLQLSKKTHWDEALGWLNP